MISGREIAKSAKSLICLLQSLVGRKVQLELRNDTYLLGTLQSVDCYMNTELIDAHLWSIYGELNKQASSAEPVVIHTEPKEEFLMAQPRTDYMFIKGCRIRYFHLPEEVDIIECIEMQVAAFRRRRDPAEKPFNWKSYRKKQKLEQLQQKFSEKIKGEQSLLHQQPEDSNPTAITVPPSSAST